MLDEAIRTFLVHDHGRVVRAVAAVCGDRQRAEDAVQEALVDVWSKGRQVDDLAGWIATAAMNRARSRWRTLAAERRAFERLAAATATQPQAHSDAPTVALDSQLALVLGNLPRSQRSTVALHYLLDLPVAEVATRLGLAEGTVKTHLHRAREAMRSALAEPPVPEADPERGQVRHA